MAPCRLRAFVFAIAVSSFIVTTPSLLVAQRATSVKTFRIRITVNGGEAEPASGSPLRFDDQIVGTVALTPSGEFQGEYYLGTRLTRRFHASYRGMTAEDQGDICAWQLDAEAPARVELRAVETNGWEVSVVTHQRDASIHTDKGSCPASQVDPSIPFIATVAGLEGPVPLERGHVYTGYDNSPDSSIKLTILDACEGTDFRDGPRDPRSEAIRNAVAGALNASGAATGPEVVGLRQSSVTEINVRLGPHHEPLPSRACLQERIDAGEIKEGSLTGATHLLVGAVQESGGTTRVTVRTVDAATGEVVATGKADAGGPDAAGQAFRDAIAQLGWSFGG